MDYHTLSMRSFCMAVVLMSACATANSGPFVEISIIDPESWTASDINSLQEGAEMWSSMGFLYMHRGEVNDFPPCSKKWYVLAQTKCRITVSVKKTEGLVESFNAAAATDRATLSVQFDSRFHGNYLRRLSTHEFGHVFMNTSWHLPDGVKGIMGRAADFTEMSDTDWGLVCATTGICVK